MEAVESRDAAHLQSVLLEIGARLSDVFGAESVLWVEGPTEERSFPVIVSGMLNRSPMGVKILGVSATGDLEGKGAEKALVIYERLSIGAPLIPPALAYVLDSENRSDRTKQELHKRSKGRMHFLHRRMYENYLLNAEAIHYLLQMEFSSSSVAHPAPPPAEVRQWLEQNRGNQTYYEKIDLPNTPQTERWIQRVDGARLLKDLFAHFSQQTLEYDKVVYGEELTRWLVANSPEDLREVADVPSGLLPSSP